MVRVPPKKWVVAMLRSGISLEQLEAQLEWRLDSDDVGRLLHVDRQSVNRWSARGVLGDFIHHRQFGDKPGSPRYYRLSDVERFARARGLTVFYDTLPDELQEEWGVGKYATLAKDGNTDNERGEPNGNDQ